VWSGGSWVALAAAHGSSLVSVRITGERGEDERELERNRINIKCHIC